jgi:hypothetical protein
MVRVKAHDFLKSVSTGEWLLFGCGCLALTLYLLSLLTTPGVEARAITDCLRVFPQFTQEQCAFLVQHHVMVLSR